MKRILSTVTTMLLVNPVLAFNPPAPQPDPDPTPPAANSVTIEEHQTGFCRVDGTIDADVSGYRGDGYSNTVNEPGTAIVWQVTAAQMGSYDVVVRFANASGAARVAVTQIGDMDMETLSFEASDSWADWQDMTASVLLSAGTNTIRLVAVSDEGLPLVDSIRLQGEGLSAANCDAVVDPDPDPTPDPNPNEPANFQAVTNQYVFDGITASNTPYKDSARFRVYYGANGLGNFSQNNLDLTLAHMESAYDLFVTDWGFRSPGLSVHSDDGPYFKMNLYPSSYMNAGGVMLYDARAGLSYLQVLASQLTAPRVTVHEFGHSLALTEYQWVDQTRTGAWWETVANWVADTYLNSASYNDVRQRFGLGDGGTIIDLNKVIGQAHLMIVSDQNYYEAWPFLTYLTNNPDGYPGLGKMAVPDLMRNHKRNNETPLHVLERNVSPVSAQTVLGRYWARMAYLDIGHSKAQQAFFNSRARLNFSNLDAVGNQTYKVKSARAPQYGGANIIPLSVNGAGNVSVEITNLGNGRAESNFNATLSVRASSGATRYVTLANGSGQVSLSHDEEVSLVVVNTPDTLYQYDAFRTSSSSPEAQGLNYQVRITGAVPQ
ncbi:DUF6055 domain-containing protein [Ketobacter sp.]